MINFCVYSTHHTNPYHTRCAHSFIFTNAYLYVYRMCLTNRITEKKVHLRRPVAPVVAPRPAPPTLPSRPYVPPPPPGAVNFLAVPAHDRDLLMTMHADRNTVPLVDTVDRLALQRQPLSAEQMVRLHWLSRGWLIVVFGCAPECSYSGCCCCYCFDDHEN